MSEIAVVGLWFAGIAIGIGIGFNIGKYLERIEWNKLIEEGKIPRPTKKRTS